MKQQLKSLLIPALLFFVGCSQMEIVSPNDPAPSKEAVATVLEAMDADGKEWSVGDEIAVFSSADVDLTCKFTCTAKNGDVAVFEGICIPGSKICALYPYKEGSSVYLDGSQFVVNADIPATQQYGTPSNVYVAVASVEPEIKLNFKPAYATIRLELVSDGADEAITSISVMGNNKENLSGAVKILASESAMPTILPSNGKNGNEASVTGSWTVGAKPVYVDMNLAAQTLENGVTVSVIKADGVMSQKSFEQNMVFSSNEVVSIPQFVFEGPKYHIFFTADSEISVPGYKVVWDAATKEGKILLPEPIVPEFLLDGNAQVTSLQIPEFITEIQQAAFRACTALRTVTFEAGSKCETLAYQAFNGCNAAKGTIAIPASVKLIGQGCLNGSTFTEITFGEGSVLETVENNGLVLLQVNKPIILPPTVKNLGNAFNVKGFVNKLVIHCLAVEPPTIGNNLINTNNKNYEIFVPAASVDAYKAAWTKYKAKIKALP